LYPNTHASAPVKSEERQMTVRRRLSRTMMLLVLGTVLLLSISGFFLLLAPSLDSVARARISQLTAAVEARVQRLALDTDRLLKIAERWLAGGGLSVDHGTLNRRFMPILSQYPEYSAMLIADMAGNE